MGLFQNSTLFSNSPKKKQSDVFYIRSLREIQKNLRKQSQMYKICQSRIDDLEKILKDASESDSKIAPSPLTINESTSSSTQSKPLDNELDIDIVGKELKSYSAKYVEPLLEVCKSQKPKLVEIAIDTLHKLISNQYISPVDDQASSDPNSIINKIVQTICDTNYIDFQDENIQLQVIKTLLQAVTTYGVHGKNLRNIVKTCFNINICSKNVDNQRASFATLTQILNAVFQRIGNDKSLKKNSNLSFSDFENLINEEILKIGYNTITHEDLLNLYNSYKRNGSIDKVLKQLKNQKPQSELTSNTFDSNLNKVSEEEIISSKSIDQIDENSVSFSTTIDADDSSSVHSQSTSNTANVEQSVQKFENQYQRDAYSIFKALCAMSQKVVHLINFQEENQDSRSLILSLELILAIIETSYSHIKSSPNFLQNIQKHLLSCLLKNCVSPIPKVTEICLKIVSSILKNYRELLVRQMGMIISHAFLKALESEFWSFDQKDIILKNLINMLNDLSTTTDIFVNLDCHPKHPIPVFEKICFTLAKLIQSEFQQFTFNENNELKKSSLKCLSILIQRMNDLQLVEDNIQPPQFILDREKFILKKNGILLFNENPEKGLDVLVSDGIVEDTLEGKASFLLNTPELSKKMIGELFSSEKYQSILTTFALIQNYSNMDFATAFRYYLSTFRLPGEGQQIDRAMRAFANSYYHHNPGKYFKSINACHTFAFAVIMLHTELHNPSFVNRDRMSVEEFINNNSECNDDEDYPEDFQRQVYDDIKKKEIKMKDDIHLTQEESRPRQKPIETESQSAQEFRRHIFDKEGKSIIKKTKRILTETHDDKLNYISVSYSRLSKMMMGSIWNNLLSSLSNTFLRMTDDSTIDLCMTSFRKSLNICANSKWILIAERDSYIQRLLELSNISKNANLISLSVKHIECVKLLLSLPQIYPDLLGTSWKYILDLYSRLEEIHEGWSGKQIYNEYKLGTIEYTTLERNLKYLFQIVNMEAVDQTFIKSGELSSNSIVLLVTSLISVSKSELITSIPRDYSLKKLITVVHFNSKRPVDVWKQIWFPLSAHFTKVSCHLNTQVAMNAIVSMRQLSINFLELNSENFKNQEDYLNPFMIVLKKSKSESMRELIIECIENIVRLKYQNITSGWKTILHILLEAAKDSSLSVVRVVHTTVTLILKEFFNYAKVAFIDLVNCIVTLATSKHDSERSLVNIDSLELCAKHLAFGRLHSTQADEFIMFTDTEENMSLWWPILTGLANLINDERVLIRTQALEVLFQKIFKIFGRQFTKELWNLIFKGVITPIFDDIQHTKDVDQHTEWITTSCHKALILLVEVFSQYFDIVSSNMLAPLLKLLQSCVRYESERLSNIGHECIILLISECWKKFTPEHWSLIIDCYNTLFQKLDIPQLEDANNLLPTQIKIICKTQLSLIEDIGWILKNCKEFLQLSTEISFYNVMLETLNNSYKFTSSSLIMIQSLKECHSDLYNVDLQLSKTYLNCLFNTFSQLNQETDERYKILDKIVLEAIIYFIKLYRLDCDKEREPASHAHLINSTNNLTFILKELNSFSDNKFKKYIPLIQQDICNLICSNHGKVREVLRDLFSRILAQSKFIE